MRNSSSWPCEPSFGCVWRFPFTRTKMTRLSYPNQREKICGPKGAVFPRLCAWWLGLAHRESICRRNVILPIIHQLPLQHLERAILTWLSALHCHRSTEWNLGQCRDFAYDIDSIERAALAESICCRH